MKSDPAELARRRALMDRIRENQRAREVYEEGISDPSRHDRSYQQHRVSAAAIDDIASILEALLLNDDNETFVTQCGRIADMVRGDELAAIELAAGLADVAALMIQLRAKLFPTSDRASDPIVLLGRIIEHWRA